MSQIHRVWKLLKTYMRGSWTQEMPTNNVLKAKPALPFIKIVKDLDKSVKFYKVDWEEFIFHQKLQKSLEKWSHLGSDGKFHIKDPQFYEEIYDLLANEALKPECVEKVVNKFMTEQQFSPLSLFCRLEGFYRRWCQGEYIDAAPAENLPQKKMLKMQAENITIGLRQVDINTGLNVMILLLELHRHAQEQDDLKENVIFYPSGQRGTGNFFTSQLLRIINYSDSLIIGNFSSVVGEFLKGGNFSGAYLADANLTGANFSGANFGSANLSDANLTGANFSGANLTRAYLADANLTGANFSDANLTYADLSSTNLSGVNLNGANLSGAHLGDADLSSANLSNANLKGTHLTSANLKDATLCGANLTNATLFGANLSDANLKEVDLSHADLCRADLSGANLTQAILTGTNLSDSILFSANLKDAILVAADLSYAKLNGAKLNGANLRGAILLGADLSGADLNRVTLTEADLSGVILNEADLRDADLSDAVLFGSDLSYANLSSANLSGCNLSGADLSYTNLCDAILSGADLSDANLEKMTWNEDLEWEGVYGLDKAVNLPNGLKEKLGLF